MPGSNADPLYVEFLRRGPDADFDAFCAEHQADAARLCELHAAHGIALAHLRAAGITAIPLERQPASSVLAKASPASGDLLRRIISQGSKGARYRLRGEIARGGMGAILRVWDEDLGRELAMKVVLGSDGSRAGETPEVEGRRISRFLEEAQITGQLDHPCIVPVHELGLDSQGHVYFTMRLVKGRDFGRILEVLRTGEDGWNETRALNVLLRVCEAMAFAHSKGVVHRDLKPGNVMVGAFGEVYVMDWGLARVLGREDLHDLRLRDQAPASSIRTPRRAERGGDSDSPLVTMEGDVLGTPAYMPPEQARGRIEEICARSDVYAIGAMLYHLLAGQMPFVARGSTRSNVEVLNALLLGPPRPLRELRPDVPAELEAICEKAMARDMEQRYADTLELAEDLRAFLEGRVVKAYQTGAVVELRKWIARNKPLAAAAAAALLFLVAGLIGSLWQKSVADRNAVLAADKAAEAEQKGAQAVASQTLAESKATEADVAARRAEAVRDFLTDMLANADPLKSMEHDVPVSRMVEDAARRLDEGRFADDLQTSFALRCTLGSAFQAISRFEESERQYRLAAEIMARSGLDDPRVLAAFDVDMAAVLTNRGMFREAEQRAVSALSRMDAAGPSDGTWRVRALQLLATARYNLGSTAEAVEYARQAVEIQEGLAGEGDDGEDRQEERVARSRAKYAFYLLESHRSAEALAQLEQAIGVLRNGSPRARVEVAEALRTRARILDEKGRSAEAIADLEEALSVRQKLFGDENVQVADVLCDLSAVLSRRNQTDRAEELCRRALDLRRELLGKHRDTATSLCALGDIRVDRGDYDGARSLFEEAHAMRVGIYGPESAAVGDTLRRLAFVDAQVGDLASAERRLTESTAIWERVLGPGDPQIVTNWVDMARVLRRTGRAAEARPLLEKALAAWTAERGPAHASTNEVRDMLATLLLDLEDWPAAEELLRTAVGLYRQSLKPGHPLVAYAEAQIGAALLGQGRLDEAEPLLLAGWEAIGENPKMWAVNKLFLLDHLASLYKRRGDEASAALYEAKADALRAK